IPLKNCSRLDQRVCFGGHKPSPDRVAFNSGRFMRSNFGDAIAPLRKTSFSNVRDFPVPKRRWSRTASSAKIEMLNRQSEQEGKSWNRLLPSALISQRM